MENLAHDHGFGLLYGQEASSFRTIRKHDPNPEHLLYDLLHREDPDSAHSRYNALIRTLVSFERAAECDMYRFPAISPMPSDATSIQFSREKR
ncbi:MAG: hypothetical protein WEB37_09765 [Bacteroidota bacterium]